MERTEMHAMSPTHLDENELANSSIEFSVDSGLPGSSSDSTRSGERAEPQSRGSGEKAN